MGNLLRWISVTLLLGALAGIAILVASDVSSRLSLGPVHQRAGSVALMLIGGSYISFQLSGPRLTHETLKGVLLGLAFVFWGGEQFLAPGPLLTALDSAVITVFVADLTWIILEHMKRLDLER